MRAMHSRRLVTIVIEPSRFYAGPRSELFENEEEADAAVGDLIRWVKTKLSPSPSPPPPKKTRHPYRDPPDTPLPAPRPSAPARPPPGPSERKAAALKELDQAQKAVTISGALYAANPQNPNYLREYTAALNRLDTAKRKLNG
jgi:hypothetical protein